MSLFSFSVFERKLDDVIELMITNSLRKDLDDTLLEKLLNTINDKLVIGGKSETGYSVKLFESSKFPQLFHEVFSSLQKNEAGFDDCIVSFAINSLGLFAEQEDVFCCLKDNKVFEEFLKICIKNSSTPFKPSTHAAILVALTRFTKHALGLRWLITNGVLDVVIASFTGSSYYVRRDAAAFFASAFSQRERFHSKHDIESALDLSIQSVVSLLMHSLTSEEYAVARESCVAVLRMCIKNSEHLLDVFCKKFELGMKLCEFWQTSPTAVTPSESLVDVIVESCLYSQHHLGANEIISEITQAFLRKRCLLAVISLTGKVFKKQVCDETEISPNDIAIILWPVIIATNTTISCELPPQYDEILASEMDNRSSCTSVVRMSLTTLVQFVDLMNTEALIVLMEACCRLLLFPGMESSQFRFLSDNPKIKLSSLHLLGAVIKTRSDKLPSYVKTLTLECLLELIGRPSNDFKFTSQALLLLGECECMWTSELLEKFGEIFQKKLLDKDWAVVDSALIVASVLLKYCDGSDDWCNFMCSNNVLPIAFDLAFAGEAEGYVRASAVRFIASIWMKSLTSQLKYHSLHCTLEGSFISNVCQLANCPDVFIQRECLSCLQQWLQNGNYQNDEDDELIYSTLLNFIQSSLDMEAHLMVLKIWQHIANRLCDVSENFCLKSYVEKLCNIGYGFSVLASVSNLDNSVKMEAINSLLRLREILCNHGFNGSSLTSEEFYMPEESLPERSVETQEGIQVQSLNSSVLHTEEERDIAITDILHLGTSAQIYNIMRPVKSEEGEKSTYFPNGEHSSQMSPTCCSVEFWKTLWSQEILEMLELCNRSSDIYANDPCALLDDIIAARVTDDCKIAVQYQQPDCY